MVTYVIGDIHGCNEELTELLLMIIEDAPKEKYRIVFLGDLIDKGPNSLGVVDQVLSLKQMSDVEIVTVMGNHEEKFIRWARHEYARSHFPDYKNPIEKKPYWNLPLIDIVSNTQFFHSMPLWYKVPETDYLIVHGGIAPYIKTLPPQDWGIASKGHKSILFTRFVNPEGFPVYLGAEDLSRDKWWAEVYDGRFGHIIYGHQAGRDVVEHPFATCIDTGCVYGEKLTAIRLDNRKLFQVEAHDRYATPYSDEF